MFQAQVKKTGNTFTARNMPFNYFVTAFIIGGSAIMLSNFTSKLYYGRGKVE